MARVETRRSRLLLAVLVLGHLVAISNQVDGGGGVSLFQRWTLNALAPLQKGLSAAVRGVGSVWSSYVGLRGVRQDNQRLTARVRELEEDLSVRRQQAEEAARLRDLLGLKQIMPVQTLVAMVIARDGTPWYRTVTIDKGSADGVPLNAPVLSPTGVVGRIIKLGPHAARVQLLIDPVSGAGARIERSRVTGVVSGLGHGEGTPEDKRARPCGDLTLKYAAMLSDVVVPDVVVTSGLDRVYPPGLLIGRVCQVKLGSGLFKDVVVASSARFDSLEQVMVVTTPLPDDSTPQSLK
jgi:rod shape-determining protein MreC